MTLINFPLTAACKAIFQCFFLFLWYFLWNGSCHKGSSPDCMDFCYRVGNIVKTFSIDIILSGNSAILLRLIDRPNHFEFCMQRWQFYFRTKLTPSNDKSFHYNSCSFDALFLNLSLSRVSYGVSDYLFYFMTDAGAFFCRSCVVKLAMFPFALLFWLCYCDCKWILWNCQ